MKIDTVFINLNSWKNIFKPVAKSKGTKLI